MCEKMKLASGKAEEQEGIHMFFVPVLSQIFKLCDINVGIIIDFRLCFYFPGIFLREYATKYNPILVIAAALQNPRDLKRR